MKYIRKQMPTHPSLIILCYHALTISEPPLGDFCFLPAAKFDMQMQWLKNSKLDVLPLDTALSKLFKHDLERDSVSITFDDGYRNNVEIALPILKKYQFVATCFLTTGLVGSVSTLWPNRILMALLSTKRSEVTWKGYNFSLKNKVKKQSANKKLQYLVKYFYADNPNNAAREIEEILGAPIDPITNPTSIFSMMNESDILYALRSGYINFGAHTITHPILSALDDKQLANEIKKSIEDVEIFTKLPCKIFAYPNGNYNDFDKRAIAILKTKNILYSLTTINRANNFNTDPHELSRWTVGSDVSLLKFRANFLRSRVSNYFKL